MRALARLDGWQQRHAAVAFPAAVVRKFLDDRAGDLAALIAYYAFFSLFPLLLVFVSVLGFVLEDDPGLQADMVDSAVARIPAVGPQVAGQIEPLTGSGPALAIGLATALWAGLGVTLALGRAFEHIWDVPRVERRGPVRARLHGLAVLAILGSVLIAATVAAGLAVGGAIGPAAQRAATLLLALAVNAVVFGAAFVLLSPRPRRPAPCPARRRRGRRRLAAAAGRRRLVRGSRDRRRRRRLRRVRARDRPAVVVPDRGRPGAAGRRGQCGAGTGAVAALADRRSASKPPASRTTRMIAVTGLRNAGVGAHQSTTIAISTANPA